MDLESRCNYVPTLQALIAFKLFVDITFFGYDKSVYSKLLLPNVIWIAGLVVLYFFTALDGIIYYLMVESRLGVHHDFFNMALVVGKVI